MGEHFTRILCAAAPRGSRDAIEQLREVAADQNVEVASSLLHGIHGTLAFTPGQSVIAGMGGEISDDLDANRDEIERLRYPRWEAEYRLKVLDEHAEHERMLVFATAPAHKGRGTPGSEAVAELINTHRPRLVVCGGPRRTETRSAPGRARGRPLRPGRRPQPRRRAGRAGRGLTPLSARGAGRTPRLRRP